MALSAISAWHMAAASLSLTTGAVQLIRPRGDLLHRRVGYVYFAAMSVNGVSALPIYKFSGAFNVFHALAPYSLFNITMALRPMLARSRPYQWRSIHYQWAVWSYAGLCAATVTEFLLRVIGLSGWVSAALGTPPVILLGGLLIRRFAPRLRAPAAASVV